MAKYFTEKELNNVLIKWQVKLRLMDWKITIEYLPIDKMKPGSIGQVQSLPTRRMAMIGILCPEDAIKAGEIGYDNKEIENSIVHELIHLHLNPFTPHNSRLGMLAVEQAIEAFAECMVEEHYDGKSKQKGDSRKRTKPNNRKLRSGDGR